MYCSVCLRIDIFNGNDDDCIPYINPINMLSVNEISIDFNEFPQLLHAANVYAFGFEHDGHFLTLFDNCFIKIVSELFFLI